MVSKQFTEARSISRRSQFNREFSELYLAITSSISYLAVGLARGWSATAVPSLKREDLALIWAEEQESWVTAAPLLGAFIGSIVAGPLLYKMGRKRTLMAAEPLFAVGWIGIAFSPSFAILLSARLLTGLAAGLVIPAAQVYVSECSHADIRGVLASLPSLFMTIGVLLSYTGGIWLQWHQLALFSLVFPLLNILLLLPLPESPAWLSANGQTQAAEDSMMWLDENYRTGCKLYDGKRKPMEHNPKRRLSSSDMANLSARKSSINIENLRFSFKLEDKKKETKAKVDETSLLHSAVYRPFLLSVALLILQQLSGFEVIVVYTVDIFVAAESTIEGHLATVLVGAVQVLATALSLFLVDRVGRKPLLVLSTILCACSMGALSIYFFHERRGEAASIGLLPLVALMVFTVGFSIGLNTIPFVLMGEILPENRRSGLSSAAGSLNLLMMFVVIKTYDVMRDSILLDGVFGFYTVCCILACFFVCGLVPETKGRTLQEIENYFANRQQPSVENANGNVNGYGNQSPT